MRFYFPESPKFRFFRQKEDCHVLTESSPVAMDREAPKNKGDLLREQEVKQASAKEPLRRNERANRVLDQIEAVQKWWATPFAASPSGTVPTAASPVGSAAAKTKPHEPLDLQDVPETEQGNGYRLTPTCQRKWFGNPAYAVQSKEQKECLPGAQLYPLALVDANTLKLADLIKIERIRLAVDKIKSPEFLNSKPVQDALYKMCSRLREGYGYHIDAQNDLNGDLQQMHRRYAFASVTVGERFLQGLDDIRVRDLDMSADFGDDVALALGEFKVYAAIQDAYVSYHGRTTRSVKIKEIAIYIMAPYGFDAFGKDVPYLGHFNKKHFALVTDGEWVNAPVYTGKDPHAKNALMRPVSIPNYIAWRQKHNKGGDMLLFSERRPSSPNLEVVVPYTEPDFKIVGRLAGNFAGYVGVPFPDLHLTLMIYNTEQGMIGIDGQPTGPEAGYDNFKKIRTNFYRNAEPTKIIFTADLHNSSTLTNEKLARKFVTAAQNFASYTEAYSVPEGVTGETMKQGEYNSGSYLAGLLHSVLGYVPKLDFASKALQAPGWDNPLPDSYFKGEALK